MATEEKPKINIAIIGHVDSGKSTLTGQLSCKWGNVDERKLAKLKAEAEQMGKASFFLAHVTDTNAEERRRGVTIQTALVQLKTDKFDINVLDCPGHADYIKNATSGCKQSDLSVVVCPARFEASCSAEGTLKTHLTLSAILGSKKFIVCINKLDEIVEVNENSLETAFDAACAAVMNLLKRLGVQKSDVIFLPISALKGVGLFKGGETYPFYKGATVPEKNGITKVFTLEDAIDYQDVPARALDKPLRMPISSIAHVAGHGTVLCGRVDYGTLAKGKSVKILPVNITANVKSIEAHKQSIPKADAGLNVGFVLETKDKATVEKIKTGSLVGPSEDTTFRCTTYYKVSCISMKKSKSGSAEPTGIKAGYAPVIACGTANVACKFAKLLKCTTKDKEVIEEPTVIPSGARFDAIIYPTKTVLFEEAAEFPGLGKFICRDSGHLCIVGHITGKITEEEGKSKYGLEVALLSGDKEALKKARNAKKNTK